MADKLLIGIAAEGVTVADWRGLTRRAPNVEVAIDGNAAAFLDRIIDRLGRLVSGGSDVAL